MSVVVHSPPQGRDEQHVAVLACGVDGVTAEGVGAILDGDYGIAVRTGLHCAPLVHADLGTGPDGAVRFSPGYFNTVDDIGQALAVQATLVGFDEAQSTADPERACCVESVSLCQVAGREAVPVVGAVSQVEFHDFAVEQANDPT